MDPNATISLGRAFDHCAHTPSYWIWISVLIVVSLVGSLILLHEGKKTNTNVDNAQKWWWIAFVFAIIFAIFSRPAEIAQNTTNAMADRGEYIGY